MKEYLVKHQLAIKAAYYRELKSSAATASDRPLRVLPNKIFVKGGSSEQALADPVIRPASNRLVAWHASAELRLHDGLLSLRYLLLNSKISTLNMPHLIKVLDVILALPRYQTNNQVSCPSSTLSDLTDNR
jgi:hypothetical protein